jgi:hypothetical protein
LWARMRFDISKLIVQVIVEFFILVFLVQDLLLLDLGGGEVGVGLEELADVFVDTSLNELLQIIDIGIVFL